VWANAPRKREGVGERASPGGVVRHTPVVAERRRPMMTDHAAKPATEAARRRRRRPWSAGPSCTRRGNRARGRRKGPRTTCGTGSSPRGVTAARPTSAEGRAGGRRPPGGNRGLLPELPPATDLPRASDGRAEEVRRLPSACATSAAAEYLSSPWHATIHVACHLRLYRAAPPGRMHELPLNAADTT
jgi:hypothetical protein